jgi:hemerythrin-like domain-containing protein
MATQNPFALLKQDHRAVEKLFSQVADTTERAEKTRTELFAEIKAALEEHTSLEEQFLYPVLEEAAPTHSLTLEAEEEHEVVKTLLEELAGMEPTDEQWTAKFTVMKENVEHHVEEEENELFPKAEKALSAEQLQEMEDNIAGAKGPSM